MNKHQRWTALLPLLLISSAFSQNSLWDHDSLRYKIGQMLIFGFAGASAPQIVLDEISQYNVGGVLLYRVHDNLESSTQAALLVDELQASALIPLMIATDQEGGSVTNLRSSNGFQDSPSAYELGQQTDEATTRGVAAMFSSWFNDIGLNTDFAPVVDLRLNPGNVIGDRSYSADPDTVVQNAYWFMDEFLNNNQITTLKHFPGHGSSEGDSHQGFTDVTNTWQEIELDPYTALIDSGCVDMIMMAHVFNAALDPQYPASLSAATVTDLLRATLGFNGVVITDAMMMGAITENYGLTQAVTLAINAGVDMLLYNWDDDLQGHRLIPLLVDHIETQVLNASIPRARIDASFQRITTLKDRFISVTSIWDNTPARPDHFALFNYPNPFNPSTTLSYELPEASLISLAVYDVQGALINTLVTGNQTAGLHVCIWNGTDTSGRPISTGLYLAKLQVGPFSSVTKLLVLR